jgi:hypothetical protein
MIRPRRDTQIPLRYRESSPPRLFRITNQPKRRRIDLENVDRNDVDLALVVIAPAPKYSDEPSILILIELPYFYANYVRNCYREPYNSNLLEIDFFKLIFSNFVIKILLEEINFYIKS